MTNLEIISLIVTILCLVTFSIVFTILFKHYYDSSIEQINNGKEDLEIVKNGYEMAKNERTKIHKFFKIISKVVSLLILLFVLFFFGLSLYSRFSGNAMPLGNQTFVVIATGSMSEKNEDNDYLINYDNQFNAYDIIGISRYNSQSEVSIYDVVAFKNKDGTIIVHRIISIEETDEGIGYITRGDSNNLSDTDIQYDGYLSYENIIGHYNGSRVQSLGIFIIFLQSNAGIITIIAIVYCLIMFDYFSNKFDKSLKSRTEYLKNVFQIDFKDYENQIHPEFTYYESAKINEKTYSLYETSLQENDDSENDKPAKVNYFQKNLRKIKNFFGKKNK